MIYSKRIYFNFEITMNYEELIAKALHGRSVRKAAQMWGVAQPTLDRYARGDRVPDQDHLENHRGLGITGRGSNTDHSCT